MAHHLRDAAKAVGDSLPANAALLTMIRRWERGSGVSERYRLHYCRALGIALEQFGTDPLASLPGADLGAVSAGPCAPIEAPMTGVSVAPVDPVMTSATGVAYRRSQEPVAFGSWITREVLMAAHESSEHAERAEHREIGDATLEQLREDVIRLSGASMIDEPFVVFQDMRRVRDRMHAALDRRLWPRDQGQLYFLLGCLSALMSVEAWHLGSQAAAEELVRAGWAYATIIDNRPLLGHLRLAHADIAYWNSQPRRCLELATDGLGYLQGGPSGALLHLASARAAARLGDADGTRNAVAAAHDARGREFQDELLEIGGEFTLSLASQHYFAGSALINLPDGAVSAVDELQRAVGLYDEGPGPGEQHSSYCMLAARVDLATANLRAGRLEAAVAAVTPVLELTSTRKVSSLMQCLGRMRTELAQPVFRGSVQAHDLDEEIERFCSNTVMAAMQSLSGGPA